MDNRDYYVGWFTLSLVIAGIAQGKNRSGLGWWLLGILLGPLALLILLLLDRVRDFRALEDRLSDDVRRMLPGPE